MRKRAFFIFFMLTGFVLLLWATIWLYPAHPCRRFIENKIGQALHRKFSIEGPISFRVGDPFQIEIDDFYLDNRDSHGRLFDAKRMVIDFAIWPLFKGQLGIKRLLLEKAHLNLSFSRNGKLNIDDLLHSGGQPHLVSLPGNLRILDSVLEVNDSEKRVQGEALIKVLSLENPYKPGGKMDLAAYLQMGGKGFQVLASTKIKAEPGVKWLALKRVRVKVATSWGGLDLISPSARFEPGNRILFNSFHLHFIGTRDQTVSVISGHAEFSGERLAYARAKVEAEVPGQKLEITLPAYRGPYTGEFPVEFSYQMQKPRIVRAHGKADIGVSDLKQARGKFSLSFGIGDPVHSFEGKLAGKANVDLSQKSADLDVSGLIAHSPVRLIAHWTGGNPWHLDLDGRIQRLDYADLPHGGSPSRNCYWLSGQLQADRLLFHGLTVHRATLTFDPHQCAFLP